MKNLERKSGITLISLVVTIIVLLILAGISITMLTAENGILQRTTEAGEKTKQVSIEEQRKLAQAEAKLNLEETEYNGVKIPVGFAPTRIEGESAIDDGLVIIDEIGNEYVWIEVPRTIEVYPNAGTEITNFTKTEYTTIEEDLHIYTSTYRNNVKATDEYNSDETTGLTSDEYIVLKQTMLKSVYENGGFWIGRYEAGIGTNRISKTDEIANNLKPLSQKNQFPLTYVTCSQAQALASRIAPTGRTSSLMFGIQWDLVLKYLENQGAIVNELNSDSTSWGNYKNATFTLNRGKYAINVYDEEINLEHGWDIPFEWNNYNIDEKKYNSVINSKKKQVADDNFYGIIITTGASDATSKKNIYDLAGNVYELTLEKTSDVNFPCCTRGGVLFGG